MMSTTQPTCSVSISVHGRDLFPLDNEPGGCNCIPGPSHLSNILPSIFNTEASATKGFLCGWSVPGLQAFSHWGRLWLPALCCASIHFFSVYCAKLGRKPLYASSISASLPSPPSLSFLQLSRNMLGTVCMSLCPMHTHRTG